MQRDLWFNVKGSRSNIQQIGNERKNISDRGNNNSPTLADIPINQACKYVASHGICEEYKAYMDNGDGQSAMQSISSFAYSEGILVADAYNLVLTCCDVGTGTTTSVCDDPNWVNLPMGGTTGQPNYGGYKNDYCDRCEQGNGTFPVSWNMNTGQWNFDPTYGTDYCKCCTQDDSPLLPCSEVPNEWCIKWTQAQQSNNPAQIQAEINNFATTYGLTYSNAQNTLIKCCSGGADDCPPNSNSPYYNSSFNFCNSDYCVDGQGNPLLSPHPDCQCCDENTTEGGNNKKVQGKAQFGSNYMFFNGF
tara:strand:+ start:9822 stop:10733 length:912 start_codon:yes stop_codon:yes gene_type:complete